MFRIYTASLCAIVALAMVAPATPAQAQTDDITALLATIQQLMERVQELQDQLNAMRGEVQEVRTELREEIRTSLREGMSSEEVRRLQQLLASDSEIYPEGLVTGYFGGLTRQALMRLQQRHRLVATGEVDEVTREVLNEYLTQNFARQGSMEVPPGLLRAPGIMQAVERGVCERGRGSRPFCPTPTEPKDTDDKKDEEKDGTKETELEVAAEKARMAVQGAQRAIDVVGEAIRVVGRDVDVSDARRYLSQAEDKYNQARRAYNAGEYRQAYNAATESRHLSNRALLTIPDSMVRSTDLRERIAEITRDYDDRDTEKKDTLDDDILRTCGLDTFKDFVGERLNDRAPVIALWERYHGQRADQRSVRFLNPGDAMTMDYIEARLNVELDENRVVKRVFCG